MTEGAIGGILPITNRFVLPGFLTRYASQTYLRRSVGLGSLANIRCLQLTCGVCPGKPIRRNTLCWITGVGGYSTLLWWSRPCADLSLRRGAYRLSSRYAHFQERAL